MDIQNKTEETDQTETKQLAETLEKTLRFDADSISYSFNRFSTTMDESLEKENMKNPLLFIPVIRCVLKFLEVDDIKSCRLVSREWGSTGKYALASRAIIRIRFKHHRVPSKFQSCFLDSATLFSAFVISGDLTKTYETDSSTAEELTKFFDRQQKYIKELKLYLESRDKELVRKIDLSSWISKSPMVQKDAKYMTKLVIEHCESILDIPLQLIAYIKELTLSYCKINLEAGTQIFPIKLKLDYATFYQDGIKLDRVRINDFVDLARAKELSLRCRIFQTEDNAQDAKQYMLDMRGNIILDRLTLQGIKIVNGETSQWSIENVETTAIPYSFNSQMKIKELYLTYAEGILDLFTLPTSIQNLTLEMEQDTPSISCSQPLTLEKLEFLQIIKGWNGGEIDCSFLSHLKNCAQLSHLTLNHFHHHLDLQMKYLWIPKSVNTLIFEGCLINWVDDGCLDLKKLVLHYSDIKPAQAICQAAKIRVDEVVMMVHFDEDLTGFLEDRKRFSFGKTLYIGELSWTSKKNHEEIVLLKQYFEEFNYESKFYVFEHGKKGRAFSKQEFYDLLPKHLDIHPSW